MKYAVVSIIFFCSFTYVNAQVVISEIMYNMEGSDAKREWVEIYNNGSDQIDFTDWRFNDGSNHVLNIPPENGGQGFIIIQAGSYVIFASDAATFLSEHPSFSGTVIDTVMSLNNTQDTLSLIDVDGTTKDSVTYTSEQGANEDGNSLQLISESWSALSPTPGLPNSSESEESSEPKESESSESNSSSPLVPQGSSFPVEPQIFADAGGDRNAIVGADTLFEGKSFGLKGEPLDAARYVWNFGNGEIKEGQNVLHYYGYPGEYVVMLNVSSGEYSASDRIIVNAYKAELAISKADMDFVEIHNESNRELNLSWWQMQSGGKRFMIPKDTIILPNKKLIFSSDVTGLDASVKENVSLLYPNGVEAVSFFEIKIPQKVVTIKPAPPKAEPVQPKAEPVQPIIIKADPPQENSEELTKDSDQTATVISSLNDSDKNGGISKWLLAIFGIVVVSAGAVVFMGKSKKELSNEIEIVE